MIEVLVRVMSTFNTFNFVMVSNNIIEKKRLSILYHYLDILIVIIAN